MQDSTPNFLVIIGLVAFALVGGGAVLYAVLQWGIDYYFKRKQRHLEQLVNTEVENEDEHES